MGKYQDCLEGVYSFSPIESLSVFGEAFGTPKANYCTNLESWDGINQRLGGRQ